MHKLGRAGNWACKVEAAHFFFANWGALFKEYGLDLKNFRLNVVSQADKYVTFNEMCIGGKVISMSVTLRADFVANLESTPQNDYVPRLWYFLILYARLWTSIKNDLQPDTLIPARYLYEMDGVEEIINDLMDSHKVTHPVEMARDFDASIVALHVLWSMQCSPNWIEQINFEDIADVVFKSRANNWDRLKEYFVS